MAHKNLMKLLDTLKNNQPSKQLNYAIPDLWNHVNYPKEKTIPLQNGEVLVDPYAFHIHVIEHLILKKKRTAFDASKSLDQNQQRSSKGNWVKQAVMYSSLIRTSSAWDHDRKGSLDDNNMSGLKDTGTFVKTIALLPHLLRLSVNTLYLLPISKYSTYDKKGDLGSPYAVANFTELDDNLKDPMTKDTMTLDEEFAALVEACHLLGMRVVIDIIPRTNAVDSDLIRNHPEWFYWVKADEPYKTPTVKGIPNTTYPASEHMDKVFNDQDIKRHLDLFDHNPKSKDPDLWKKIKNRKNILDATKQHYNLTIAKAFSDYINDTQPPWSDVTFFRLYLDHPEATKNYLDDASRPPYILYDTIKANKYPGKLPNMPLWNLIADVIPSYQRRFGIDGARIDMGHALPKPLLDLIMEKARAVDEGFAFIAEELNPAYAKQSKDLGYNMIIGNGFFMTPRIAEGKAHTHYYTARDLALPSFACSETHDTPRIASREGKETTARLLTILNMFTPGSVPFINAGQEVFEVQPMNLGLDASDNDLYHLDESDPYYKKLALFDKVALHYMNPRRHELPNILAFIKPIRQNYRHAIMNKKAFVPFETDYNQFVGYAFKKKNSTLLVFANLNPYYDYTTHLDISELGNTKCVGKLVFSTHEHPRNFTQFIDENTLDIHLGNGEIKLVEF